MNSADSIHPEFGDLICRRRGGAMSWFGAILLIPLSLFLLYFCGTAILAPTRGNVLSVTGRLMSMAIPFAGAAACLFGGIYGLRTAMAHVRFYRLGVVRRVWRSHVAIPYQQATSLTYQLTRQFVNGVYAGTTLLLDVRSGDGRRIRHSGTHKERAAGLFTMFTKKFEGTDELDTVRAVISAAIADGMQSRMLDGGTIDWCGQAVLSADGLTPRRGGHKRRLIPWGEIERQAANRGMFYFFRRGEGRSFVGVMMNRRDFWPCLEVAGRMIRAHTEASQTATMAKPLAA